MLLSVCAVVRKFCGTDGGVVSTTTLLLEELLIDELRIDELLTLLEEDGVPPTMP